MAKSEKYRLIRYIYLYLVTAIAIVLLIISTAGLVKIVLEEYVFDVKGYDEFTSSYEYKCPPNVGQPGLIAVPPVTEVDRVKCLSTAKNESEDRHINDVKRDLVQSISLLLVALPLYLYHWGIIRRESKK